MQVAQQRDVDFARRRRARDGAARRRGCASAAATASTVGLSVGVALGLACQPGQPLLHRLQVGQDQLGVHRLDVARRIDPGVDVDDVVVVEGAHHLADGVGLADGGQELVAQPLPLRRAAHEAGDVDEGHRRRHHRRAVVEIGQLRQPRVGHGHDAHVGLDGGEGVVGRQHLVVGERVEERGLAHVGQPDDADGQAHAAAG